MPPSIKNKYQNSKNPSASQEVPIIKNSVHGKYGSQWGERKKQNRQFRFMVDSASLWRYLSVLGVFQDKQIN